MSCVIKAGDMVQFERGVYKHWGVCVSEATESEEAQIVHAGPENGGEQGELGCSRKFYDPEHKVMVRKDPVSLVADGDKYKVNNYLDGKERPRSRADIVNEAMKQLKEYTWKYDLRMKNCEAFAIWLRYRIEDKGKQVKKAEKAALVGAGGLVVVAVGAVGAVGVACLLNSGNNNRSKSSKQ